LTTRPALPPLGALAVRSLRCHRDVHSGCTGLLQSLSHTHTTCSVQLYTMQSRIRHTQLQQAMRHTSQTAQAAHHTLDSATTTPQYTHTTCRHPKCTEECTTHHTICNATCNGQYAKRSVTQVAIIGSANINDRSLNQAMANEQGDDRLDSPRLHATATSSFPCRNTAQSVATQLTSSSRHLCARQSKRSLRVSAPIVPSRPSSMKSTSAHRSSQRSEQCLCKRCGCAAARTGGRRGRHGGPQGL
jgi:hypothetical protein